MQLPAWASELRGYGGLSVASEVVVTGGHYWLAKSCHTEPWREVLPFGLGRDWLNVAQVVEPGSHEDLRWVDERRFQPRPLTGRVLVRIAQDLHSDEIPIHDLDQAIAYELVFSIWIRRRDAHAWNRTYIEGVPVFFDHHIAFGAEPENIPIDSFFREGSDPGFAGRWRVREMTAGEKPTTEGERTISGRTAAIHRVRDLHDFDRQLDSAVAKIQTIPNADIEKVVAAASTQRDELVVEFLNRNQGTLTKDVQQLREIVYAPDPI